VSVLLSQVIKEAVEVSETKESSWNEIISTAKPYLNLESHDLTDNNTNFSTSEAEEFELNIDNAGAKKRCHVPYAFKYDFFQDEDTTTSDARTSQDEEPITEDKKSLVVRKRKLGGSGGAFSRGAYTKKRRKKSKQLKIQAKSPSSLQNSPQHVPKSPKGFTFQRQDSATSLDEDNAARSNDENTKSEDETILGKGKRKRFQNVRMLPIEEVCKSPPRKKSPSN